MTIATLTCVGCGKKFEGDRELVPEFTTASGAGGAGGNMCQECFNATNALRASAGYSAMPTPPAGAWGALPPGSDPLPPVARAQKQQPASAKRK
jgi:hypothetical protein